MGVKIFRSDNLDDLAKGYISANELRDLDREKDKLLLDYLIVHAPERYQKGAMRMYHMKEVPELLADPHYPEDRKDESYHIHCMLAEQAARESDRDVLINAAFNSWNENIRRFAFSRLTGYDRGGLWGYTCGLKSDMLREDIEELCHKMIDNGGPLDASAENWLGILPDISDETLDEWASGKTERFEYRQASDVFRELIRPDGGAENYADGELKRKMLTLFDAYVLYIYEKKYGDLPRRERLHVTDKAIRLVAEVFDRFCKGMTDDTVEAVRTGLLMSGAVNDGLIPFEFTDDNIRKIVWSESEESPLHGYFLDLARKYDIE